MGTKPIKAIAFFDVDGTITRKDTFIRFIVFDQGELKLILAVIRLLPWFIFGFSRSKLKEKLFSALYRNKSMVTLQSKGDEFATDILPRILRPSAMQAINWHLSEGHDVCIVTGSSAFWLRKFCLNLKTDLIATEYEVINGYVTGHYASVNCKGEEKVKRIKQKYDLKEYDTIYAYGDSKSDMPMLNIATHPFYRCFSD